jgi:hypothetical protein
MRCKYNNRGSGVFYVVSIYPMLGNGYIYYVSAWRGPAAYKKGRSVLSSERAPQKNKTVTVKE